MQFDYVFSQRISSETPIAPYLIACSQRTGSTILANYLWSSGTLGAPMSYFNPDVIQRVWKTERLQTDADYFHYLRDRRSSPNGVFGYKVQIPHLRGMRRATPFLHAKIRTRHVIFLKRRNEIAQAISLYKAETTGKYSTVHADKGISAAYDFAAILARLKRIRRHNEAWEAHFREEGISPLRSFYEDVKADMPKLAADLHRQLGVEPQDRHEIAERPDGIEKLANAESLAWEQRFRSEHDLSQDAE